MSPRIWHLHRDLKKLKNGAMLTFGERIIQAEGGKVLTRTVLFASCLHHLLMVVTSTFGYGAVDFPRL